MATLRTLTDELRAWLATRRQRAAVALAATPLADWCEPGNPQYESLLRLLICSDYALDIIERQPQWLPALWAAGDLQKPLTAVDYIQRVASIEAGDEILFMQQLRQLRQREMLRWIWRDANQLTPVPELTQELSWFADACIEKALEVAHSHFMALHGEPQDAEGKAQRLCVIAMGKLGAGELNLSSDIDLIFAYPEAGETSGERSLSNQEFFVRVGQKLIRLLDQSTAEGFVFRVDMRLRPWGDGSALASSFSALEAYYERHGREWERYALIKARICAGDRVAGQQLMNLLRPFVYRRYIDFGVFEALRDMKAQIASQVRRKGMDANIKLGAGGIREVEFIAQVFQLVRGGVEHRLQARSLLLILALLGELRLVPVAVTEALAQAYLFLRRVEHRLQMRQDQQTQTLPSDALSQARLAVSLDYPDWPTLLVALDAERAIVETQFRDLVLVRDPAAPAAASAAGWAAWMEDPAEARDWLNDHGYHDVELVAQRLAALQADRTVRTLPAISRERLDRLMPLLLCECARHEQPDNALLRCLPLVESVLRRTAYMMLLIENPAALGRLVDLSAASPWIAAELAAYPVLLDELLNAETLFAPPARDELVAELRQQLLRIPEEDVEAQMHTLRLFKKAHVLRVAASDLKGTLPLMKVSDYLTWIAEAVLQQVLALSWRALVARHGIPHDTAGQPCDPGFVILAYGKLGGIELGYGSDLDLVFLHDADPQGETDGTRPLDNPAFFARLGQKVIHYLTLATSAGLLYEVDTRLRPSGNAGLLVSSLGAFARYQRQDAWTWEHQALVRARPVAGDAALAQRFGALRQEILCCERDRATLQQEVVAMRQKMRTHLGTSSAEGQFALKQDEGGIVDIEFMVQYGVLAWAHEYPELTTYPDNVRILEGFATLGLLPDDAAVQLRDAYLQYRAQSHRLALSHRQAKVNDSEFLSERRLVRHWWQALLSA